MGYINPSLQPAVLWASAGTRFGCHMLAQQKEKISCGVSYHRSRGGVDGGGGCGGGGDGGAGGGAGGCGGGGGGGGGGLAAMFQMSGHMFTCHYP